jgi:hypothetical protein
LYAELTHDTLKLAEKIGVVDPELPAVGIGFRRAQGEGRRIALEGDPSFGGKSARVVKGDRCRGRVGTPLITV